MTSEVADWLRYLADDPDHPGDVIPKWKLLMRAEQIEKGWLTLEEVKK